MSVTSRLSIGGAITAARALVYAAVGLILTAFVIAYVEVVETTPDALSFLVLPLGLYLSYRLGRRGAAG